MNSKLGLQDLEDKLSEFIYEVDTESRLVRAGLKEKAETAKIYQKYKDLFGREVITDLKKEIEKTFNKRTKDILERIYFTLTSGLISFKTANIDDAIKTYFSNAKVEINGGELAYFQLSGKIAKETIFEKREIYDDVSEKIVAKINSRQLALLKNEINLIKTLGFSDYLDYFSKAKKINYAQFFKIVQKIKKDTDSLWALIMPKVSQEIFSRPFKNIRACHLLYLRSLTAFDNFYPKEKVVSTFLQFAGDLGFADLLSRIKIDDKDRSRKNPRAVCYWPKPPDEIHLIIKPIGGEQDFEAMFHEGGHALHGAACDPKLPYTLRNLARSHALTETFAFLLEDLVFDPLWLSHFLNISAFTAEKIKKQAIFVNLMILRRYLGKYSFEYEMFFQNAISKGPLLYSKNLQETTDFITKRINWLSDMDSGFYSADYLRAWIASAQIKDYLLRRFGKRWFLNKKAGNFLRQLFARGVTDEVEDMVHRFGYKPFDIAFLVNNYKEVLG